MRVGAAAKFGNRTSRIFFLQGEQGFTSSLALILPHRVWDYPLRHRPAAYPVINTALEIRSQRDVSVPCQRSLFHLW